MKPNHEQVQEAEEVISAVDAGIAWALRLAESIMEQRLEWRAL